MKRFSDMSNHTSPAVVETARGARYDKIGESVIPLDGLTLTPNASYQSAIMPISIALSCTIF